MTGLGALANIGIGQAIHMPGKRQEFTTAQALIEVEVFRQDTHSGTCL